MNQPVYTLICHRDIEMALVTLPKIYNFLESPNNFFIFGDGSLTQQDVDLLKAVMPLATINLKSEREEFIKEKLKNYPNCLKYRDKHPLTFKLLDVPIMAGLNHNRFTFTDSDIIYLKNCEDYFNQDRNTHLTTDGIKISVKLQHALLKYNWKIPFQFNSGYFSFGLKDYDLDFIEYFLGLKKITNMPWLFEQTCWGLLFSSAGKSHVPNKNQFACEENFSGANNETLAIHLIADLKKHYKEWSSEHQNEVSIFTGVKFHQSRNINYLDWAKKVIKRFL